MSAKCYEMPISTSVARVRDARLRLKEMSRLRKLELMVEAGVMTQEQADRAKRKLAETSG